MEAAKDDMVKQIIQIIKDDDFQKDVVKELNSKLDGPLLNEKQEKMVFNSVYNVLEKVLVKQIKKLDL
jgi:predicted transcriptional regulator